MVVDYSKWDKLELSDDSDVEVHPNVDKASFIRWRQRDIHQKREEAKHRLAQLNVDIDMNEELYKRVVKLQEWSREGGNLKDLQAALRVACEGFAAKQPSGAGEAAGPMPTYEDMMRDLIGLRLTEDDVKGDTPAERLNSIANDMRDRLDKAKKEKEVLIEERSRHINSEDIHFGWDNTIINKEANTEPPGAAKSTANSSAKKTETETSYEVLNPKAEHVEGEAGSGYVAGDTPDELTPDPKAAEFAKIPVGEYEKDFNFLMANHGIVNEREKDALMMVAFQEQLEGRTKDMERTVHNALLLQYCATLGPDGVRMFFSKITQKNHPALQGFLKDVQFTVNHVKTRCQVILQEREEDAEEVEQIQLHSLDPNTEIVLKYPEEDDTHAHELIASLPKPLQDAIKTGSLEEINKVLGNMVLSEAEEAVQKISESGLLQLEGKVYDKDEWAEEQQRLEKEGRITEIPEESNESEPVPEHTTVDELD